MNELLSYLKIIKKNCSLKIKVSEVLLCFKNKEFDEKVLVFYKNKASDESISLC